MRIDKKAMEKFVNDFDVINHKFLYLLEDKFDNEVDDIIIQNAPKGYYSSKWNLDEAINTYRTIEKVYGINEGEDEEFCGLVQQVTEEFLGNYVGIEGITQLFRSSYFNFEWMMHLEYKNKNHSYSYYRDHYIHQIRNMYEMFVFLDDLHLWEECLSIIVQQDSKISRRIMESVKEQLDAEQKDEQKGFDAVIKEWVKSQDPENPKNEKEEMQKMIIHYIIFATSIVSSLIHDIGYPLAYMKRTLKTLTEFLPLSCLFINVENEIPRINNLLYDSMLFEIVGAEKIEKRLKKNDHGALSAIILLMQYYDNGKIYHLMPMKRMVLELSAVVIYNHTLKYNFQNVKDKDAYDNIFINNPISYLFRLCDDIQEWERVYFEISQSSNFFICNKCGLPMVKNSTTELHDKKHMHYECFCGSQCGINTNLFSYRRLINVAPFTHLEIETRETKFWKLSLYVNLGSLLQVAKYNPTFSINRVEGIKEIKKMLKKQSCFPKVYMTTFITNNPFAIKIKILKQYIKTCIKAVFDEMERFVYDENVYKDYAQIVKTIRKIQQEIEEKKYSDKIYDKLQNQAGITTGKSESVIRHIFTSSISFYLTLLLVGKMIFNMRDQIYVNGKDNISNFQQYLQNFVAELVSEWKIYDNETKRLLEDFFIQELCYVSEEDFRNNKYIDLYEQQFTSMMDSADIVQTYINNGMYDTIRQNRSRISKNNSVLYDFYSDYYLYYAMNAQCEKD